jgi:formamidopyrimidine-DNA glycosylase (fpg)
MPELPEVETVRTGLAPALEGQRLIKVTVRRAGLRTPFPRGFAKRLTGQTVMALRRRAKYLLAELDGGETLIIHLGMSGRVAVYAEGKARKLGRFHYETAPPGAGTGKHDHVVFETAVSRIVYTDPRRFGLMTLVPTDHLQDDKLFADLGVEPLSNSFHSAYLAGALKAKKTPIKSALLDQRVISGIGNIYACEALFRAGISPKRLAGHLRPSSIEPLTGAIKQVLTEAIAAGGSTLRDYRKADGELGYFQHTFKVYGREGEPCPICGTPIKRIVQAGRSTFYCPKCQS